MRRMYPYPRVGLTVEPGSPGYALQRFSPILTQMQSTAAQQTPRPGPAAAQLLPSTQAERVPGSVRQRYEVAEQIRQHLLGELQKLLTDARGGPAPSPRGGRPRNSSQSALTIEQAGVCAEYANLDTNKARELAGRLQAGGLSNEAFGLRNLATAIDNCRASQPAPGGAPLQAPGKLSEIAITKGFWGCSDRLPHRDVNGVVYMWSETCDGPVPNRAPPKHIIDAQGRYVYGSGPDLPDAVAGFVGLPGMSFIVKPAHFNDDDGDKNLQSFIGAMIPVINSAIGLGMVPYTDPTLHSEAGWKPVWSSFGRDPRWGTYSGGQIASAIHYWDPWLHEAQGLNPNLYPTWMYFNDKVPPGAMVSTSTEAGTSQRGILAAAAALMQMRGFKEFLETVWVVPDGTPVRILHTDPFNLDSPLIENVYRPGGEQGYSPRYARVLFHRPEIAGGGALATAEGFIPVQDLQRKMEY